MTGVLKNYRVLDLSSEIAGAYATRLLADAGADVVKVEPPTGDPLRRWSVSGNRPEGEDGALFRYLHGGHRSVVIDPDAPEDRDLLAGLIADADAVVWGPGSAVAEDPAFRPEALQGLAPHAAVLSLSPYGLTGPWVDRPASDATIQASSGGPGQRGDVSTPPMLIGGRFSEWVTGMQGAMLLMAARWRVLRTGRGELVDVSALEATMITTVMHPMTWLDIAGSPIRPLRMGNIPDIHPTKDGFVGFMVVTGQQWLDFCAMTDRLDWAEDETLGLMRHRVMRRAELTEAIDAWTSVRTTDEIVELASALRVPAAQVTNGASLPGVDHFEDQGMLVPGPHGFLQPRAPWRFHGHDDLLLPPRPAPALGQDTDSLRGEPVRRQPSAPAPPGDEAPFTGLRVVDFTANWAGPVVGHTLALLGADVIHVESAQRPDPIRFNTTKNLDHDQWWEYAPLFQGSNTNKRDVTLDLSTPQGLALAKRLIASADVVLENYSPRVMENLGLDWAAVHEANPSAVYVRMPAYGLSGPWRDRGGYAQTMEMAAGLAWRTGLPEGRPVIPNGPCDPVAGGHATVGLLLALEHRRQTGEGMLVEVPMIGGALNIAAEGLIEFSAYGSRVDRIGNRAEAVAPQGVYLSADPDGSVLPQPDRWVAVSVTTDEQWQGFVRAAGSPAWACEPQLASYEGRRAAHDVLDERISEWVGMRSSKDVVDSLVSAGVPVAVVVMPHETADVEQLASRGIFVSLEHPVTGRTRYVGLAGRFRAGPDPDVQRPAPLLGQDNRAVLVEELGLSETEYEQLIATGVVGTKVGGGTAW